MENWKRFEILIAILSEKVMLDAVESWRNYVMIFPVIMM